MVQLWCERRVEKRQYTDAFTVVPTWGLKLNFKRPEPICCIKRGQIIQKGSRIGFQNALQIKAILWDLTEIGDREQNLTY